MNAVPVVVDGSPKSASTFAPDHRWWRRLFEAIDAGDAKAFVAFLTPDAQFRFGNAPVVVGVDAIDEAVTGFFGAIRSSHHQLGLRWTGETSVACEGVVTYTRLDGTTIAFPFANVFDLRGEKIAAYRIYIDNALLLGSQD
jgi:ketosteroid isomerase-like protein